MGKAVSDYNGCFRLCKGVVCHNKLHPELGSGCSQVRGSCLGAPSLAFADQSINQPGYYRHEYDGR